jgi:Family of unknown function (DUF6527)
MDQISSKLRRAEGAYVHWCPGCHEAHRLPDRWTFDGNLESPTFTPSFRHSGVQAVNAADGSWTGEFVHDAAGEPVPFVCHYILTAGVLNFCGDSTHALAGQSVELQPLPPGMTD